MKVALIKPPEIHAYWGRKRPSLGISYLSSYLTKKGVSNKLFDANYFSWSEAETIRAVKKYKPDLIGLTSMTHEIAIAHHLAKKLQKIFTNIPVVVGGCHVTALPEETLKEFPCFTCGIFGEGEKTLLELVNYFGKNKKIKLENIDGLVYRNEKGEVVMNKPRERLSSEELDQLPYPAFDAYYKNRRALVGRDDYYVIMTSRGCPYHCAFCMQVLGRQVHRRTPEGIVAEIKYAIEHFGAHTIQFCDEIFLFNDETTYKTLDLIIESKLNKKIRWQGLTRVNMVNKELIRKAKESGCYQLDMGIESGSNRILKRIHKQITVKQAERAVEIIKREGIKIEAYFILGHPGETRKTIKKTVDLLVRLNTTSMALGIMVPYPGTEVYELAKNGEAGYRLLSRDWSTYDKYGGKALEIKGLPLSELEWWQRKALVYFYLKNYRFLDFFKFIVSYRRVIFSLLRGKS